jgi:hypothetical protein
MKCAKKIQIGKLLLEHNCPINQVNNFKTTCIHEAVKLNETSINKFIKYVKILYLS